jgi:hypothetical protein
MELLVLPPLIYPIPPGIRLPCVLLLRLVTFLALGALLNADGNLIGNNSTWQRSVTGIALDSFLKQLPALPKPSDLRLQESWDVVSPL